MKHWFKGICVAAAALVAPIHQASASLMTFDISWYNPVSGVANLNGFASKVSLVFDNQQYTGSDANELQGTWVVTPTLGDFSYQAVTSAGVGASTPVNATLTSASITFRRSVQYFNPDPSLTFYDVSMGIILSFNTETIVGGISYDRLLFGSASYPSTLSEIEARRGIAFFFNPDLSLQFGPSAFQRRPFPQVIYDLPAGVSVNGTNTVFRFSDPAPVVSVPLPGSAALLLAGMLGLVSRSLRRSVFA